VKEKEEYSADFLPNYGSLVLFLTTAGLTYNRFDEQRKAMERLGNWLMWSLS